MRRESVIALSVFLCVSAAVRARAATPDGGAAETGGQFRIAAETGGAFRSVDAVIFQPGGAPAQLYYLAVEQGSAPVSAGTVLSYIKGEKTEGLDTGLAARGRLFMPGTGAAVSFRLYGAENVSRLPGETGFVDGYRYDIYFLALGINGKVLGGAAAKDVMAQPFSKKSADGRVFLIEAAGTEGAPPERQLANIQRLADLYAETDGRHGSADYLTNGAYTFILNSDIDIQGDWTPIGGAGGGFAGTFDGNGHVISGLKTNGAADGKPRYFGLFGRTDGAEIRNLTIDGAQIEAGGGFGAFAAGLLAGETSGGVIENIELKNSALTVYCADMENSSAGGLVGGAYGTEIRDITVNAVINASALTLHVGGVAGVLDGTQYPCGAGAADSAPLAAERLSFTGSVSGGCYTGGIAGLADDIVFTRCAALDADVSGRGYVGGFAGLARGGGLKYNANHRAAFYDCGSSGAVYTPDGLAGGFAGVMLYAAAERCYSSASVHAAGGEAGGFAGRVSHRSRAANSCATGGTRSENGLAGGFAGVVTGNSCIEFAYSGGDVSGGAAAGGFAGRIALDGAPNTLTGCFSFAKTIAGGRTAKRFAAEPAHNGVNGCYAYFGGAVTADGLLSRVSPGAYRPDAADVDFANLRGALSRAGWSADIWELDGKDENNPLPVLKSTLD